MNLMHIATQDRVIQMTLVEKYNVPSMRTYSLPQKNKGSAVLYVNQYESISIQGVHFFGVIHLVDTAARSQL